MREAKENPRGTNRESSIVQHVPGSASQERSTVQRCAEAVKNQSRDTGSHTSLVPSSVETQTVVKTWDDVKNHMCNVGSDELVTRDLLKPADCSSPDICDPQNEARPTCSLF